MFEHSSKYRSNAEFVWIRGASEGGSRLADFIAYAVILSVMLVATFACVDLAARHGIAGWNSAAASKKSKPVLDGNRAEKVVAAAYSDIETDWRLDEETARFGVPEPATVANATPIVSPAALALDTRHWRDGDEAESTGIALDWEGKAFRTMCVRLCDGYAFPVSVATTREGVKRDARACAAGCSAQARLFIGDARTSGMNGLVDTDGRPYSRLPNAFRYQTTHDAACSCRAHPWEQEAQARHRSFAMLASVGQPEQVAEPGDRPLPARSQVAAPPLEAGLAMRASAHEDGRSSVADVSADVVRQSGSNAAERIRVTMRHDFEAQVGGGLRSSGGAGLGAATRARQSATAGAIAQNAAGLEDAKPALAKKKGADRRSKSAAAVSERAKSKTGKAKWIAMMSLGAGPTKYDNRRVALLGVNSTAQEDFRRSYFGAH